LAEAALFLTVGRTALSYGTIVTLGGASFAAGLATLAFFPTLVPVVGANLGLGAGLALLYFAFVNVAHAVAPDDLQSTAQTLLTSVGIGAGGALGQVVSGWLVDAVGVQRLYLFLGATALLLVVAGVAVHATVGDRDGDVATA
jgi:PPP family 3-phenylpropionic acid transporter